MKKMEPFHSSKLLEVYKSLDQQANVDFKNKNPVELLKRLEKMLIQGGDERNKRNFTGAYVYFKRWLICVEWLQKQKIKNVNLEKYFDRTKIENVKESVKEAQTRIQRDFETNNSINSKNHNINGDNIILPFPEVPTEEPSPKGKDEIDESKLSEITCEEVLTILNRNNKLLSDKILIIDTRKSEDYEKCRMSFKNNYINVSIEKLNPSKSMAYNEKLLTNDKSTLVQIREKTSNLIELIVLLDSNSSSNTIGKNSSLAVFKNCLKKLNIIPKNSKVVILKGGFDEWSKKFPNYVEKYISQEPSITNNVSNDNTDHLNNHPINENFKVTPVSDGAFKTNIQNRPTSTTIPSISDVSSNSFNSSNICPPNETFKSSTIMSDTRQLNVKLELLPNSQIMSMNNKSTSMLYNHVTIPTEKPSLPYPSATINGDYNAYQNGFSDRQLLRTNNIKEPKVILQKVDQSTLNKPLVDRSNKPVPGKKLTTDPQISKPEMELTKIREKIMQLKKSGNLDDWPREEYDVLIKREQELTQLLDKFKTPPSDKLLYPELPTMPLEIKRKTLTARSSKTSLSNEEKENVQKPRESFERMSIEPSTPVNMEVDEEIYKEPLKCDNQPVNSRMKRSISSPNLVQNTLKEDRKAVPEVDRSSKPRLNTTSDNKQYLLVVAPKDREQSLNPVYASSNQHPGITGLKNLGNSCYMNSIIQCLSNTQYLANYFIDCTYTHDLNIDKNYTCVAEEVAHVIKALWRGTYKTISPLDLKVIVGHYKLQFKNHDQQDSHEFLTFLLEWMHNDLKKKSKLTYSRQLTTIEMEWEKSMNGQSSIISKLFFGLLRSTVQCLHCQKNSTTYETFNSLTMSLPLANKCTLDECVRKFVSGQRVSGWNCPNCKVPRDGEKKFDIAKLPHIVVIHLNRFGDTGGWLEKKNTAVDFPLVKFDLRPYLVSDDDSVNNSQQTCYNLYAISNHYGTMDRGHYTAYCKSSPQNKWYKYDDHTVTEVPQYQVKSQSSSAYLLFYTLSTDVMKE